MNLMSLWATATAAMCHSNTQLWIRTLFLATFFAGSVAGKTLNWQKGILQSKLKIALFYFLLLLGLSEIVSSCVDFKREKIKGYNSAGTGYNVSSFWGKKLVKAFQCDPNLYFWYSPCITRFAHTHILAYVPFKGGILCWLTLNHQYSLNAANFLAMTVKKVVNW